MSISEITNSVKPLDIVNKINEVIPVTNASVPDGTLSESSTNSIQNKVVTQALNDKQNSSTAVTHSQTTAVGDTVTPVYVDTDGSVKTISNSLGTAAFQNITSSYSASGTAPINGTAVASALANINVDQTYNALSTVAQSGTAVAEALTTLSIPEVDQTYSASSTSAQSGTAVASAVSGILPDQTGNEGKFLTTDGTIVSWETVQGGVAQIQSDWLQSDNTKKDFIKNKPTALSSFTDDLGSLPTHTHSQYQLITQSMTSLSASGTVALTDNTVNKISATGTVTFTLPSVSDTTKFHQIFVQLYMSTARTINLGTTYYFNKEAPDLSAAGTYNLIYEYDNTASHWVCGVLVKGSAS